MLSPPNAGLGPRPIPLLAPPPTHLVERTLIPDNPAVDTFRARHAAVRDHFIKLGIACADIARRLVARHAARRVGDGIGPGRGHNVIPLEYPRSLGRS
jgi:hypothetical protein